MLIIENLFLYLTYQNKTTMLYTEQIEKLKGQLDHARSNYQVKKIETAILKLAKAYNIKDYKDFYLILGDRVYGLQLRTEKNNWGNI